MKARRDVMPLIAGGAAAAAWLLAARAAGQPDAPGRGLAIMLLIVRRANKKD